MPLKPGSRLGPYEISAPLGAGGMGEVFRARDTRLNRDVAVKVLPPAFVEDRERVARFRREAQLVASLNHPNIAAIYGLEETNGTVALALELVEGEDLAQRLARGPILVDEAIAIARQIAEGLEAAHERGIVHRDLKPANVKVTPDGAVKILDFGLAKAREPDPAASDGGLSRSPTMSRHMTEAGMILGTAAYMSPEQARGKPVDKRSDIWSFGVVLFELLTGRRVFAGETVTDVLAAVLTRAPDWSALPMETPARLRALLERSLERDPRQRLRDIGEARVALSNASARVDETLADASRAPRRGREVLAWGVAAVALLAAALFALRGGFRAAPSVRAARLSFEPPPGVSFDACQTDYIVVSPDGRMLVFTGRTKDGKRQLWLRAIDSLEARRLPDTDDPLEPFWSPDSRSIAFGAQGKLKRLDLSAGRPQTLADAPRLCGGTWNREGVILFVPDFNGGIFRVPAQGGDVQPAMPPDPARKETGLRAPEFLPDGKHFIYMGGEQRTQVFLASLDAKGSTALLDATAGARYAPPGWLLFARGGVLYAQRFDAGRRALSGDAIAVPTAPASAGAFDAPGAAGHFSVSENGVVVWQRSFTPEYQLVWFDRSGARTGVVGSPIHVALTMAPRLSPDGTRIAMQNREPQPERLGIWVIDLLRGIPTRLSPVMGQFPNWSPDGTRVAWLQNRAGAVGIYQAAPNGAGREELLIAGGPGAGGTPFPADWSPDGRFFLYVTRGPKTRVDIWTLPLFGDRRPRPVLVTEFDEQSPQVSPDGRWIAYRSDSSGTYEVYLQSFTRDGKVGDERFRVSQDGGSQPRFRRDGRELFYLAADGRLMAVSLKTGGAAIEIGPPTPLFMTKTLPGGAGAAYEYDVTADGQRFLVGTILDGPDATPPSPVVVLGWQDELKDK
ncbi:MAG TPA: protein kinase [Thermoanaerobaculia bacterium]|nr:protein kinase [Thermoanaerobaculia bacterium]